VIAAVLRAIVRLFRLLGHLVGGLRLARRLDRMDEAARLESVRAWLAGGANVLGVTVAVEGEERLDVLGAGGSLWLPNHVSWLDIPLLGGIRPGTIFLAKSEIRHWPVIGRMAMLAGTAFIERGRGSAAAAEAVAGGLAAGRQMVVFAEGTTSDGHGVCRFHARLLGPAIAARAPVVPVAIRYLDARGERTTAPAFIGRDPLWPSLWRVLSSKGLQARVDILEPIAPLPDDPRSEIARRAHHAVSQAVATNGASRPSCHA